MCYLTEMQPPFPESMTTRMSTKGQVVIPRNACEALGVRAGTQFFIQIENGAYRLIPQRGTLDQLCAVGEAMRDSTPVLSSRKEINAVAGRILAEKDARIVREHRTAAAKQSDT